MRATDQARRTFVQAPDPESIPKIWTLEKVAEFYPGVRIPDPALVSVKPFGFTLLSVTIEGDLAHARVDWDYGLTDDILVNKNGSWYLVGEEIIQWHGG